MVLLLIILLTTLSDGGVTVTQDGIREAVDACVRRRAHGLSDSIYVEYRSAIPSVEENKSGMTVAVRDEGISARKGNMTFPVEIVAGSEVVKRFTVSVRVRTFGKVAIAARQIDRHEQPGESDVEIRIMETTSLPADVLVSMAGIQGMRTTKILLEGGILTARWFERPPDIRRRDTVTLLAKGESMLLSATAVALEDGKIGEEIQVRRKGASGPVVAKVIDAGTVQITLGDREYVR